VWIRHFALPRLTLLHWNWKKKKKEVPPFSSPDSRPGHGSLSPPRVIDRPFTSPDAQQPMSSSGPFPATGTHASPPSGPLPATGTHHTRYAVCPPAPSLPLPSLPFPSCCAIAKSSARTPNLSRHLAICIRISSNHKRIHVLCPRTSIFFWSGVHPCPPLPGVEMLYGILKLN